MSDSAWRAVGQIPWRLARLSRAGRGQAGGVLRCWLAWERFTCWRAHLQPARPGGLLRYRREFYRGPAVTLGDGTVVRAGDPILELHLDNSALLQLATSPAWTPGRALRLLEDDLRALAALQGTPFVALHGVTLLAGPGRRLHFECRPLPRTWRAHCQHLFLAGLLAIYHPAGWHGSARRATERWPAELWLSADALQRVARDTRPAS
ncbi:MAG: hypothetical protein IRZ14_05835 [Chloroflexi bacterium]|nr:hypothetical protein [Chloroflexota bacterium]